MAEVRQGSNPNFAPPMEEGMVLTFEDERGELQDMEFLGLLIHNDLRYGFFYPLEDGAEVGGSGEVIVLEAVEFDEDDQPCGFEAIDDEALAQEVYEAFMEATKDIYVFG